MEPTIYETSIYNQGISMSQVNAAIVTATSQLATGYTPKGEASVATLNGLTGQENGELYTMTDAGTLTDGSLAVVAGDTVAWDATNEVWYKAMDYAPSQYGTNEVHNLSTTITAFRTGDVIPVDGPDGTAKMTKDDLLKETAENTLGSIHSLSDTATEADLVSGNYLALDGSAGTKKLDVEANLHTRGLLNNSAVIYNVLGASPDLNNAPKNSILQVSAQALTSLTIANIPSDITEKEFVVATLNPRLDSSTTCIQILASKFNEVYFRIAWGTSWTAWKKMAQFSDITESLRFVKAIDRQVANATQAADVFGSNPSIDKAPMNTIISNGYSGIKGVPSTNYYGTVITLTPRTNSVVVGYSDSLQFWLAADQTLYYRRYKYGEGWLQWNTIKSDEFVFNEIALGTRKYFSCKKNHTYRIKTNPTSWAWTSVSDSVSVVLLQKATNETVLGIKKTDVNAEGYTFFADTTTDQYNVIIRGDSGELVNVYISDITEESLAETNLDLKPCISTFRTMGVVGSSSASGEVYAGASLADTRGDHYEISWPQVLGRNNGIDVTNYSEGGMTTRFFLQLQSRPYGLRQLLADDPKDIYVLTLGGNDRNVLGAGYLGTSADITTFADTFYGNYSYIISKIKEHAPIARIVIMTNYFNRQPNLDATDLAYNQAVEDIATYYGIPVIHPEKDPYFLSNFGQALTYGHPRVTGYAAMAKAFRRMIEQCMFDNRAYFDDVSGWEVLPQP